MKATFLFIFLFLCLITLPFSSKAQIPNPGFESWYIHGTTGFLTPTDWAMSGPGAVAPIKFSITRTTTSHSDSFAVQGEVVNLGAPPPFEFLPPTLESRTVSQPFGFTVSERHAAVKGFYQFFPLGGDQFQVSVLMLQGTTGVGIGVRSTPVAASTYTPFTVNINYSSSDVPTNCAITVTIVGPTASADHHLGSYFLVDDLSFDAPTAVAESAISHFPERYELEQNYPNPFNPSTEIRFGLPREEEITLAVYNVLGARVRTLAEGASAIGHHRLIWDGSNDNGDVVGPGMYFYRLETRSTTLTKKMILLK